MSGKTKKLFSKINFVALLIFAFVFLAVPSCEVGLGPAVDTKVPELSISQPTNDSAPIRGSFAVSGLCKDDGEIEKITVTLQGLDEGKNNTVKKSYEATKTGDAKTTGLEWSCVINKEDFMDGKYEITVEALDTYHHSTIDKVAISIDNTPPILVLQRPSTIGPDSPDTYGQEFTLEGQAADDSDVGRIEVNIYTNQACTEYKDTIVLEKVPPTVSQTVMKWAAVDGNPYQKLYGTDKNAGTKTYFCKLVVYDDARPCPDEGEGAGKGNASEVYYLYNDLYTPVLSDFKLTQVYSILNGTFVTSDRAVEDGVTRVKETLASENYRIKIGSFALNPLNNPTFTLNGYDALEKKDGKYNFDEMEIINGSMITVKVSSGLDKIPLENDTLGIDLIPVNRADPFDANGDPKAIGDAVHVFKPAKDKDGNALITDPAALEARAKQITNVGSYDRTIIATLSKDDGLRIGGDYVLQAVGYDQKGNNTLNPEKRYGFNFTSMGVAPTLSLEYPEDTRNFVKADSTIRFKGTTYHEEGQPNVKIYLTDSEIPILEPPLTPFEVILEDGTKQTHYSFDYTVNVSDYASRLVDGVNLNISSEYNGKPKDLPRTITYDVTPPEVKFTKATPIVSTYEVGQKGASNHKTHDYCVNGTITVGGNLYDSNGLQGASYVVKGGDTIIGQGVLDKDKSTFEITIDTLKVDECDLTVDVTAIDNAGNSFTQSLKNDAGGKYYIWQESDKPAITVGMLGAECNDPEGVVGLLTGATLNYSLSDDDGLKKVTTKIYRTTDDKGTKGDLVPDDNNKTDRGQTYTSSTAVLTATPFAILPSDVGLYWIEIKAEDIVADRDSAHGQNGTNEYKSLFYVESGAPQVSLRSEKDQYVTTESGGGNGRRNVKVSVNVNGQDGFKLYVLTKAEKEATSINWGEFETNKNRVVYSSSTTGFEANKTITADIVIKEEMLKTMTAVNNQYNLMLIAKDTRKSIGVAELTIIPDDNKPVNSDTKGTFIEDTANITNGSNVKFSGESTDTGGSLVQAVYYKRFDSEDAANAEKPSSTDSFDSDWQTVTIGSGGKWDFILESKVGDNVVLIYSVDGAGNYSGGDTSTNTYIKYTVDNVPPTVSDVKVKKGGVECTTINAADITAAKADTNPITIEAEIEDSISGVNKDEVKLYNGNTEITDVALAGPVSNVYTFTLKKDKIDTILANDNTYNFVVKAKDMAKNEGESVQKRITVDKTAPEIKFEGTGISSIYAKNGDVYTVNGKIKISGSVSDNSKLGSQMLYKIVSGATASAPNATSCDSKDLDTANSNYSSWNFVIDTTTLTDNTTYTLFVAVKDALENISEFKSVKFKVDQSTDIPVITSTNTKWTITTDAGISPNNNLFESGSSISVNVKDDDGLASITYKIDGGTAQTVSGVSGTEMPFTIPLAGVGAGTHTLEIVATDIADTLTDTSLSLTAPKTKTISGVTFAIDDEMPKVSVQKMNKKNYTERMFVPSAFTVEGSISDDTGVSKIEAGKLKTGSTTEYEWSPLPDANIKKSADGKSATWTESLSGLSDGSNIERKYKVTDKYGKSTVESFHYDIDTTNPVIDYTKVKLSGTGKAEVTANAYTTAWNTTGALRIKGDSALTEVNPENVNVTVKPRKADNSGWDDANAKIVTFPPVDGSFTLDVTFDTEGENLVIIDAEDKAGLKTVSAKELTMKVDKTAPVVSSGSVNLDNAITNSATITVSVSATDATSGVSKIYIGKNSGFVISDAIADYTNASVSDQSISTSDWRDGTYTLYARAVDNAGLSSTDYELGTVTIDTTAPVVTIKSYEPYVTENGARKVNGKIRISGAVTDNTALGKAETVKYVLKEGTAAASQTELDDSSAVTANLDTPSEYTGSGATEAIDKTNISTSSDWSFVIDTTGLDDNSTYTLSVQVTDHARNKSVIKTTSFVPDQNTDIPKITSKNTDWTVTTEDGITPDKNLFENGSSISVTVTDDDGLASITYKIDSGTAQTVSSVSGVEKTFTIPLTSVGAGTHTLEIVATDTANALTEESLRLSAAKTKTISGVKFAIDNEMPKVNVTKMANKNYSNNGMFVPESFTVEGSISDDTGVSKVELRGALKTGSTTDYNWTDISITKAADGKSATWTDTVSETNGNGKIRTYRVTDIYGKSTQDSFTYNVDTIAPVLNGTQITLSGMGKKPGTTDDYSFNAGAYNASTNTSGYDASDVNKIWNTTGALTITGAANVYTGSTITTVGALTEVNPDVVEVVITPDGGTAETTTIYPAQDNSGGGKHPNSFAKTISLSSQGKSTVVIKAKDLAGQESSLSALNVYVDTVAPVIQGIPSITFPTGTGNLTTTDKKITNTKSLTINVNAADTTSKVKKFYVGTSPNFETATTTADATVEGNNGTATINIDTSGWADGTYTLYVRAEDNAGLKGTDVACQTFTIDRTPPTATITEYTPYVGTPSSNKVNGKITIKGTSADTYKIADDESVELEIYNSSNEKVGSTVYPDRLGESWSYTLDTTTLSATNTDATFTIKVKSKDAVGLKSTEATKTITVNQGDDKPVITPSGYKTTVTTDTIGKGNNLYDSTNNKITATITDDDGISAIKLYYTTATGTYPALTAPSYTVPDDDLADKPTTYSLTWNLPKEIVGEDSSSTPVAPGKYKFKIVVEGSKNETSYWNNTSSDVYFGYTLGDPVITSEFKLENFYTSNSTGTKKTVNPAFTVSNVTGINKSLVRTIKVDDKTKDTTLTNSIGAIKDTIDLTGSYSPVTFASGKTVEVTYTATNIFGQTGTVNYTFTIDNTAPVVDGATLSTALGNLSAASDIWFNTSTLALTGTGYSDDGSGLESFDYWIQTDDPTNQTPIPAVTGNIPASGTGFKTSIDVGSAGETKLWIQAKDGVGNKSDCVGYSVKLDSTEPTATLQSIGSDTENLSTKLANGDSPVEFTVEIEDVGGSGIENVMYEHNNKKRYAKLYATDIQAVSRHYYDTAAKATANGSDYIELETTETVTKGSNPVATGSEVYLYTYGGITTSGSNYTVTIPATFLVNGPVKITVTDGAGNRTTDTMFSVEKDNTPPVVTFTSHGNKANVNKTITLSGIASDTQGFDYATLEVSTDEGANYTKIGDSSLATPTLTLDGSTWSKVIDTTDYNNTGTDKTVTFKLTGYDKAGNSTPVELSLNVNQDTDRPIVKVQNLVGTNSEDAKYSLKDGDFASVSGSVDDDDKNSNNMVKDFIVTSTEIQAVSYDTTTNAIGYGTGVTKFTDTSYTSNLKFLKTGDSGTVVEAETITVPSGAVVYTYEYTVSPTVTTGGDKAYDVTVFIPSTGEWTFYPYNIDDGTKTMFFNVLDNNNAEFYTKNSSALSRPYFQYKTSEKKDKTDKITYVSDGTSPAIGVAQIYGNNTGTGTPADTDFTGISTDVVMGGTRKTHVTFKVTATDNNGIASMTLEMKGKTNTTSLRYSTDSTYTQSGNFVATNDSSVATWKTGYIDLSSYDTEEFEVKVYVYDQCGLRGNGQYSFRFDKTPPTISAIKIDPTLGTGDVITGSAAISGATSDEGGASVESIKYMIPLETQQGSSVTDATLAEATTWIDKMDSGKTNIAWQFTFDKDDDDTKLARYEGQEDTSSSGIVYNYVEPDSNGVYTLPVYIMATDTVGNVTIDKTTSIKYDPDGDKPKITVSKPDKDKDNSNNELDFSTLSGTIRPSGTVKIPGKTIGGTAGNVAAVYIQIDEPGASNEFGSGAKEKAGTSIANGGYGYTVVDNTTVTGAGSDWWGIKVDLSGDTWETALNRLGELNPSDTGTTHNIKIRVCGVNTNGRVGDWSAPIEIHVAKSIPHAENVTLQQYSAALTSSTAGTATPTIQKAHAAKTYLKGNNWYLAMDLEDTTGIDTVSATYAVGTENPVAATVYTQNYTSPITGTTDKYNKKVWIAIPSGSDGKLTFTVTAKNNSSPQAEVDLTWNVYIDNTAPNLTSLKTSISGDTEFSSSVKIHDSNDSITFKGFVDEGDDTDTNSGFERSVFYFMRDSKIIDPFDFSDGTPKKAKVTATKFTIDKNTDDTDVDLYGTSIGGTLPSTTTFTATTTNDVKNNTNIRVGGIVRIEGLFRTITAKSGDTVTFTPAVIGKAANASATAEFVYGQVVDHKGENNAGASGYGFSVESDDGDGMYEYIGSDTKAANWQATIRSTNMADGPVALVVVTFDRAGNVSSKTITGSYINNNPPRLAKVFLGTDLNGNGSYSANEFVEYKFYASNYGDVVIGEEKKEVTTNGFKIKDKLAVVPEIVGGNGNIKMVFSQAATSLNNAETTGTGDALRATSSTTMTLPNDKKAIEELIIASALAGSYNKDNSSFLKFEIPSNAITVGDGTGKKMSFTFWDSTEDTTQGTTSQAAVLYVPDFEVDLVDEVNPNVVINKFFWKSKSENSLYGNSTANGHIELEDDLILEKNNDGTVKTATKAYTDYGADPKVSGKIVIRGTAYDDRCLKQITVSFGDTTNATLKTAQTAATYSNSDGWSDTEYSDTTGWGFTVYDDTSMTAEYARSHYGIPKTEEVDGKTVTVSEEEAVKRLAYFGQDGHKVAWELTLDTEKLLGTNTYAALDQIVTVVATDTKSGTANSSSGRTASEDAGDGTMHRPEYQMDVVPYVTKVTTGLSSVKEGYDGSIYNRTALGHYPVTCDTYNSSHHLTSSDDALDTITLTGFNLGTQTSIDAKTLNDGKYDVVVNSIKAVNNYNNNDARGVAPEGTNYDNWYNRYQNNANNNELNDDIIFDVWEINSSAASSYDGVGTIREPVMKVNPANGVVGLAFGNGPTEFSMPLTNNAYQKYQSNFATYVNVSLAYDESGWAHGTATGVDTYKRDRKGGRFTYFTSKWGTSEREGDNEDANFQGTHANRFESIGLPSGTTVHGRTLPNILLLEQRFYSPSIAVTRKNGNNSYTGNPRVYLAYYDYVYNQIRFRAGINNSDSGNSTFGQFWHNGNNYDVFAQDNCSVIAGQTGATSYQHTTVRGGNYVSIDIVPGTSSSEDVVVATWFDADNNNWMYSYNTAPNHNADTSHTWNSFAGDDYKWSDPQILSPYAGEYCKIAVASDESIHIACKSQSNEILYTYINKYNGSPKTVKVETYEAFVSEIGIDVEVISNKAVPYISYMANNRPKLAFPVNATTGAKQGYASAGDVLTGVTGTSFNRNWEATYVPTRSNLLQDHINVSVVNSTAIANGTSGRFHRAASDSGTTNHKVYTNGSSYPIMGYGIRKGTAGYIEIAQRCDTPGKNKDTRQPLKT